jgi:hypothetical protein
VGGSKPAPSERGWQILIFVSATLLLVITRKQPFRSHYAQTLGQLRRRCFSRGLLVFIAGHGTT